MSNSYNVLLSMTQAHHIKYEDITLLSTSDFVFRKWKTCKMKVDYHVYNPKNKMSWVASC